MPKLLLSLLMSSVACVSFAAGITKPVVEILATGGTIAGVAASQTSTTYQAGSLSAKQLIDSVSGLGNLAEIRYEQVYNKDSGDITVQDWLKLEAAVRKAAADPAINAIVITHGTDTLEETAYFLNLVAKTTKPVVLVGSMRAATSMSADGPMNLYNAVAVAVDKATARRGVLVAMNEDIFAAREVQKTNTTSVQTFQSPGSGPLGHVAMGHVSYQANPVRANMANTPFSVAGATKLPEVAIVYAHVGMNTEMLNHLLETKDLKGIVMAGVGDGNIPAYAKDFLQAARKKGIVVVRSSRVGSGTVSYDYNNLDTTYDLIAGDNLAPGKARVLLMLSLMKTSDTKAIQQNFYTY